MSARPGLGELCRVLLKHAAFTVGGGGVTMVALERDLVEEHKWLERDRFRTIYGFARLTPGTSILALVTGLGWHFHAYTGALAALALNVIPGSILAALLAAGYEQVYGNDTASRFLIGSAAAVCGLIGASIWRMTEPYLKAGRLRGSLAVFVVTLGFAIWGISPFPAFIAVGVAGYLLGGDQS